MKITEITVSAGRVIPHPRESHANLRPMISLKASVEDSDRAVDVARSLQIAAEALLNDHIANLAAAIEAEYQAERKRQEEAYDQRQRERLAASAGGDADALDDDEIEDDEDDDETPFET